jgi:MraZ protein
MLFLGTYEYSMDERGRVPMPPPYRQALLQGLTLTQGSPDTCVRAYPNAIFEEQARHYMAEPITRGPGRLLRQSLFPNAYQVELDRQGRVLVPTQLRRFAGLDGQVVIAGVGEGFEIWSGERYLEQAQRVQSEVERLMEA